MRKESTKATHNIRDLRGPIAGGLIFAVALSDLLYDVLTANDSVLNWTQIALIALAVFTLFADRITEFTVSPTEGIKIKSPPKEAQIQAFQNDLEKLDLISEKESAEDLEALLESSNQIEHGVWTQLIIYRLAMRALLRRQCLQAGMQLSDTPSLDVMLKQLRASGKLGDDLYKRLQQIRHATFAAEWGGGTPPRADEIRYALEHGPELLRELQKAY